jgi:hypothetical protein
MNSPTLNRAASDVANLGEKVTSSNTGKTQINTPYTKILSEGVDQSQADALFAQEISKNEQAVKETLKAAGVTKIPKNVFDGLVSFQNQCGNISYAFVRGEKIDLMPMYQKQDWDRAASFIAADERDTQRRIREAAMIANNSYGRAETADSIVRRGLEKTNGLIAKGKLNSKTGDPATDQQLMAASAAYYRQTGKTMPSSKNFKINRAAADNELRRLMGKRTGPWPY